MWYSDAMLLWRELEDSPPVRMTFARFVGYKGKSEFKPSDVSQLQSLRNEMMKDSGKDMLRVAKMPQRFKDSIRYAEEMKRKMGLVQ
jgi:hypothetical protein